MFDCGILFDSLSNLFPMSSIKTYIITSTALYSLETTAMIDSLNHRLDVTQRLMLRRMVGWISYAGETWEDRGRRMKMRLEKALQKYPMDDWSIQVKTNKIRVLDGKTTWPEWTKCAVDWFPPRCAHLSSMQPYRYIGRPLARWSPDVE